MCEVTIRRAKFKDIPQLDKLLFEVHKIHSDIRPDLFTVGEKKYTDEELERIIVDEQKPIFVAEHNGKVKGYAFCIFRQNLESKSVTNIKTLYIDDLCVDEDTRGMHIGTNSENAFAKCKTQNDIFALDKELMQIFEQTYGPVTRRKHAPEKRHVKAVSSIDKAAEKYKKSPVYDGTEYLLVDGYNVIFAWEHLKELSERSLDGARHALINILCNYQGYSKCNLILVFDAYKVKGEHREVEAVNNISIVYTKEAETADMFIEKTSHKLAKTNKVRVVTSDALEQMIILGNGALRVSSRAFLEEVRQAENEIREIINSSNELNNNMN